MTTDPVTGQPHYTVSEQLCLDEARVARMEIQERLREIYRKYPTILLAAIPDYRPEIYH